MTYELIVRLMADATIIPVVLVSAYVLLFKIPKGHRWQAYSRIFMAGLTAYLIARFAAAIYHPSSERPFELLGLAPGALSLNNPGFPSDHLLFVTALTIAVWCETKMKKTTILLAVMVVIIAVGRVLALVHTPLDVIGGIVIALIGGLWYLNKPKGGQKVKPNGKSNH